MTLFQCFQETWRTWKALNIYVFFLQTISKFSLWDFPISGHMAAVLIKPLQSAATQPLQKRTVRRFVWRYNRTASNKPSRKCRNDARQRTAFVVSHCVCCCVRDKRFSGDAPVVVFIYTLSSFKTREILHFYLCCGMREVFISCSQRDRELLIILVELFGIFWENLRGDEKMGFWQTIRNNTEL